MPDRGTVSLPRAATGRNNRSRWILRGGACAAACLAACVAPAVASAHGRAATVALDYRLPIDPSVGRLIGIEAHVVDGDRALQLAVADGGRVTVFGDLGEPMLRFSNGVWVNQSSPTAQANRLVRQPKVGWKRIRGGRAFSWHEHRLAPPPFVSGHYGPVARWQIPIEVNGRRATISGSFWRVRRPAFWPWALAAAIVVGLAVIAIFLRPRLRAAVAVGAGIVAGLAGLTAQTAFSLRDAPSGNIGWALIVAAFLIAAIATWGLTVARGKERGYVAGAIGVSVAVFCLSWLGVFFHGAVVSALSAPATRVVCAVAFTAGLVSLISVLAMDAPDEVEAR